MREKRVERIYEMRNSQSKMCLVCSTEPALELQVARHNLQTGRYTLEGWKPKQMCGSCARRTIEKHNDPQLGQELAKRGMAAAYNSACEIWKECALRIILDVLHRQRYYNADDLWPRFESEEPLICPMENPAALGGIHERLAGNGDEDDGKVMKWLGKYIKSRNPKAHRAPKKLYISLLYSGLPGSLQEYTDSCGYDLIGDDIDYHDHLGLEGDES